VNAESEEDVFNYVIRYWKRVKG